MHFEHLLEVNDHHADPASHLDHEALWFGLLYRAENPAAFLPGLTRCEIHHRSESGLSRSLHFGAACVRDEVRFGAPDWIAFESAPAPDQAGGRLTIRIEAPEPGRLFLRFCYQTSLGESGRPEADQDDARYLDYVKSAYYQSDLDTLAVIRALARDRQRQ